MKTLSVQGSRGLEDERVKITLLELIDKHKPEFISTCAEPDGACKVCRKLAKEIGLPLKLYFLNFKYRAGAFERRSKDLLKDSNYAVFFWDGKSKGTANEIALAKKAGIPHEVHEMDLSQFKNSVGFGIDDDVWNWENDIKGESIMDILQ